MKYLPYDKKIKIKHFLWQSLDIKQITILLDLKIFIY